MSASLARWSSPTPVAPASGPRPAPVEAFGISDPGLCRPTNEDAYAVVADAGLFVVADGMGGHAAGEVASRMAVDTVRAVFEDPDLTWPVGLAVPPQTRGAPLLKASIEHANARVHAASLADPTKEGMGTTLTALLVLAGRIVIGHVGDSRAYRLRGPKLELLTHDHTYINMLLDAGAMTSEQAATSNLRNVLARSVGSEPTVKVDARLLDVEPGDTFLLATDGLHGVVDDTTLAAVLLHERDLTRAAAELVHRANDGGGPDNITAVLLRIR
ncbi:MAG TPA: Stp1/IreP family PP2C-type Ser/Thr phosphatase [Polyangiaceae bacterium]|nr:Stp1/IreP family PP2C-type Ser/Thr phosphatase [Polyangiaceae bacterium]